MNNASLSQQTMGEEEYWNESANASGGQHIPSRQSSARFSVSSYPDAMTNGGVQQSPESYYVPVGTGTSYVPPQEPQSGVPYGLLDQRSLSLATYNGISNTDGRSENSGSTFPTFPPQQQSGLRIISDGSTPQMVPSLLAGGYTAYYNSDASAQLTFDPLPEDWMAEQSISTALDSSQGFSEPVRHADVTPVPIKSGASSIGLLPIQWRWPRILSDEESAVLREYLRNDKAHSLKHGIRAGWKTWGGIQDPFQRQYFEMLDAQVKDWTFQDRQTRLYQFSLGDQRQDVLVLVIDKKNSDPFWCIVNSPYAPGQIDNILDNADPALRKKGTTGAS